MPANAMTLLTLLFLLLSLPVLIANDRGPNVVIFLPDDMGWQQVGYNGGQDGVPTPNIDRLAHERIRLTQFYLRSVFTPARGALVTGGYAWKTGAEVRSLQVIRHGDWKLIEEGATYYGWPQPPQLYDIRTDA